MSNKSEETIVYIFLVLETVWMFAWFGVMCWFNIDTHGHEYEPSHFVGVLHTLSVPLLVAILFDIRHKERTFWYILVAFFFVCLIDIRSILHSFYVLPNHWSSYWTTHFAIGLSALILSVLETVWFFCVIMKEKCIVSSTSTTTLKRKINADMMRQSLLK